MKPLEISALGPGRPPIDVMMGNTRRLEEVGFDALWYSDHFLHWFPPEVWTPDITPLANVITTPHDFMDPMILIAAAGAQTERIRFGTAVTDAIRRHPAVLAQTFLTLDHTTRGRTMLGIGVGEAENILPFGLPYDRHASRLIEALEIIRLLWSTSEPVDFDGDFWSLDQAILGMEPYGDTPPEIWMAAHRPRVLRAAGRFADGWMPVILEADEYAKLLGELRSGADEEGRDGDAITAGLFVWVVVDEDREAAARMIDSTLLRFIALTAPNEEYAAAGVDPPTGSWGLIDYVPTQFTREQGLAAAAAVPEEVLRHYFFWGTPDDIVDRLRPFREAGLEHVYLVNVTPLADITKAVSSAMLTDDIMRGLRTLD